MFDPSTLYASLLWGAVGSGLLIYGKKLSSAPAIIGGLCLVAATFFAGSAGIMSLAGIMIVAAVWFALRLGY